MRFLQSMLTTLVSTPLRITRRGIRELNDVGRNANPPRCGYGGE